MHLFYQPKQEYNGQADYWWLRSPNTDNTNRRSSLILSDGGINHFVTGGGSNGWYVDNSYGYNSPDAGGFALRAPPTATALVWSSWMAASATTSTISGVPTAKFALRTPVSLAMRIGWIRMAVSTATTGI